MRGKKTTTINKYCLKFEFSFRKIDPKHDISLSSPEGNEDQAMNDVNLNTAGRILSCNAMQQIDFLKDPFNEMTHARRLALKLMQKKWYNPNATVENFPVDNNPSLERAWAYFEHFTLPRYIASPFDDNKNDQKQFERSEPGEDDIATRLYSPIFTPLSQMGDFGIGVGLYFSALRYLSILTLIAGIGSIPSLAYFSSNVYSKSQVDVQNLLKGTAICTDTSYVPCSNCKITHFIGSEIRFQESTTPGLNFALKNNCPFPPLWLGLSNWAVIVFIVIGSWMMNRSQNKMLIDFDEDEQTAQDYSIQVNNPPCDATDPEEFRDFFSQFHGAHVTCCTIVKNNDLLIQSLLERRKRYKQIERLLRSKTGLDTDGVSLSRLSLKYKTPRKGLIAKMIALFLHPLGICLDVPALCQKITVLNSKIRYLSNSPSNPVTNVFITFETESAQREVLSCLSVGRINALRNRSQLISKRSYLFRSKFLLDITEPEEPSAIRWQDLNETLIRRLQIIFITTFVTLCAIALIGFIVKLCCDKNTMYSAIAIAGFNFIFPKFSNILTNMEAHKSESERQTSLYVKIALFRWVNTAIVINIITPFTYSVSYFKRDSLLPAVYAIFFAEIVTTNVFQFLDLQGHLNRHVFAPRAPDQDTMNSKFQGCNWDLCERYTNMSKTLFLCYYYCTIYPSAFFMCSFSLFISYYADSFSLMRSWARVPKLGTSIALINQKYIVLLSLLALVILSSYWWAGFPFDNLCFVSDGKVTKNSEYFGHHLLKNSATSIFIEKNQTMYKYCNQNLFQMDKIAAFPALPRFQPSGNEWMTKDQETITTIFGWTSVVVLILVCMRILWFILKTLYSQLNGITKFHGKDMGINFSDVKSRSAYIPQVITPEFSFPLITCRLDCHDDELFDWESDKSYDHYNITLDVDKILSVGDHSSTDHLFSKMKHWNV